MHLIDLQAGCVAFVCALALLLALPMFMGREARALLPWSASGPLTAGTEFVGGYTATFELDPRPAHIDRSGRMRYEIAGILKDWDFGYIDLRSRTADGPAISFRLRDRVNIDIPFSPKILAGRVAALTWVLTRAPDLTGAAKPKYRIDIDGELITVRLAAEEARSYNELLTTLALDRLARFMSCVPARHRLEREGNRIRLSVYDPAWWHRAAFGQCRI